MKKTIYLIVIAFTTSIFSSCTEKKDFCECVKLSFNMIGDIMSGNLTEEEAEKKLAGCEWLDDLSDEEAAKEGANCLGDIMEGMGDALEDEVENTLENAMEGADEIMKDAMEGADEIIKDAMEGADEIMEDALEGADEIMKDAFENEIDKAKKEMNKALEDAGL